MPFHKNRTIGLVLSFFVLFIFAKQSRISKNENLVSNTIDVNVTNTNSKNHIKNTKKKYKYVIFDVSNCFWQKSLYDILMSFKKTIKIPFSGYLDLLQCGISFALGNLDAKKGYETFFKYCKSMSKQDIQNKCNLIWKNDCKDYIYNDAFNKFEKYKKKGFKTIAVDAGISQLYTKLVKKYKFDYVFTTSLELQNGLSNGKLHGEPCSGKNKFEMVKKLIEKDLNGSLKEAIFYGNSHNDIPLLEKVGKPIAVNPNNKLLKKAKNENWKILYFKELKKDS